PSWSRDDGGHGGPQSCSRLTWFARFRHGARGQGHGSAQVDRDRLDLCHGLQRESTSDASDPTLFARPSAEGHVQLPVVAGVVYDDLTDLKTFGNADRSSDVAREDRTAQAQGAGVRCFNDGVVTVNYACRGERPERFLSVDEGVERDIPHYRGLNEKF